MPIVAPLSVDTLAACRVDEPPPRDRIILDGFAVQELVFGIYSHARRGDLVLGRCGFLLGREPDTLLAPDGAYVRAERVVRPLGDSYVPYAPDLAVELVVPRRTSPAAVNRATAYLDAGTRAVWLVLPRVRLVLACTPDRTVQVLTADDELDGGDVLPGFRVRVADLFRDPFADLAPGDDR